MSSQNSPPQALQSPERRVHVSNMPDTVKIFFVTSYPRSDMGKGTLVVHLQAIKWGDLHSERRLPRI